MAAEVSLPPTTATLQEHKVKDKVCCQLHLPLYHHSPPCHPRVTAVIRALLSQLVLEQLALLLKVESKTVITLQMTMLLLTLLLASCPRHNVTNISSKWEKAVATLIVEGS